MTTNSKTTSAPSKSLKSTPTKNNTARDYSVDPRRPWLLVSDDGKEAAVLMAKNISKLTKTISAVKDIDNLQTARKTFKQFLELIDFAPVTIDEKRHVLWKQGKFAGRDK